MRVLFALTTIIFLFFLNTNSLAISLTKDAEDRGINKTCQKFLNQIESSYNLNGLNITFAHPKSPSLLPSLHISSQKYNNGSSSFSATLIPDGKNCYLSTIMITAINNQSCLEIAKIKASNNNGLQSSSYAEGNYIVLTPQDNSYQTILTSVADNACTITETRMMWPGK